MSADDASATCVREALAALRRLNAVTGVPGLPARTFAAKADARPVPHPEPVRRIVHRV